MAAIDPSPSPAVAKLFGQMLSYAVSKSAFSFDWELISCCGRLTRSARVYCVAQDPGAIERIANRTPIGDADQQLKSHPDGEARLPAKSAILTVEDVL